MILYHVTKYKLGDKFKSKGKTCCAPTLSKCILGLQALCCFKNTWRKHSGPLYIYKCKATHFYDGCEFDSHITHEKIVASGTEFKLVGSLYPELVVFLDKTFTAPLYEAHSLLEDKERNRLYRLSLKMIYRTLKGEILFRSIRGVKL